MTSKLVFTNAVGSTWTYVLIFLFGSDYLVLLRYCGTD
jgi:hypothetical protein